MMLLLYTSNTYISFINTKSKNIYIYNKMHNKNTLKFLIFFYLTLYIQTTCKFFRAMIESKLA